MIDDWVHATPAPRPISAARSRAPASLRKRRSSGFSWLVFLTERHPNRSTGTIFGTPPDRLSLEDGAATLTEMTAAAAAAAGRHFPQPAEQWLVTGGGRHNPALMEALRRRLGVSVRPVEAVGWEGDALEARAFAYLAVRSLEELPLSLPSTTGVPEPTCGGRLFKATREQDEAFP